MLSQGPYSSESLQFAGISRVEGDLFFLQQKLSVKFVMESVTQRISPTCPLLSLRCILASSTSPALHVDSFPQNHLGQLPVSYAILSLSYGGRLPEPRAVVSLGGSLLMKVSSLDYCLAFSEQFSSQQVEGAVMHVQKHQK